jgi:hypothetical protein
VGNPRLAPRRSHCASTRRQRSRLIRRSYLRPTLETLEPRNLLAFSVTGADVYSTGGLRVVVDFNQPVDATSLAASDLSINGSQNATSFNVLDADSVAFFLPNLSAGNHTLSIAQGAVSDTTAVGLDAFSRNLTVASSSQYTIKYRPYLQPGNAALVGTPAYVQSPFDRADIMWETQAGAGGTQDSFTVDFRPAGIGAQWQAATQNTPINTGDSGRIVRSASITGLNWNSDYEYRVRQLQGDVIVNEYLHTFKTRLAAGDQTPFVFAAYGDSASGAATGYRQEQSRIKQVYPSFTVLLGEIFYNNVTHTDLYARFDPVVNP